MHYSTFINKVREYETEGMNLQEAMKKAVEYCQKHDILKNVLEDHASEVLNMLMVKWNMDDALAVRYDEGRLDEREEVALNALKKGYTIEEIQDLTKLSIEAIEKLKIKVKTEAHSKA